MNNYWPFAGTLPFFFSFSFFIFLSGLLSLLSLLLWLVLSSSLSSSSSPKGDGGLVSRTEPRLLGAVVVIMSVGASDGAAALLAHTLPSIQSCPRDGSISLAIWNSLKPSKSASVNRSDGRVKSEVWHLIAPFGSCCGENERCAQCASGLLVANVAWSTRHPWLFPST